MKKLIINMITISTCILSLMFIVFPTSVNAAQNVSVWNGKTYTKPTKKKDGYLLIQSSNELAWVLKNKSTNGATKIKLTQNIDMKNKSFTGYIPSSVKEFSGNKKYIKNLKINGTGLFGTSKGLKLSDLTLNNVNVTSSKHAGILVGTLKGNSTFINCKITSSSVVTTKENGIAGGYIGYIVRSEKTNRSISLTVTLKNCSIEKSKITASSVEGKFVGVLSGYDNKENLTFTNCSATSNTIKYKSSYTASNQSSFLKAIPTKYNGFLGRESYYRGIVKFDGNRFMRKWNGKSAITPLLADPKYDGNNVTAGANKFVVYSPFDLAGIRKKTDSPSAIYLKANIDMNGQGKDKKYNVPADFAKSAYESKDDNNFPPFKAVAILDGDNKTIYNLAISQLGTEQGAFILTASGTTVHKNINFKNCQTVATHKKVSTNATAKGAILIAIASGSSYTMENVNATNCRVFALQKVGTLAGYIGATNSSIKKCKVENCYVENYKCNISERFSGKANYKGVSVLVYADFYPQGEVGGMFGFVQNNATISDCHVKGTTVHAYGQADKMATVSANRIIKAGLSRLGYYKVPGRHVSTFIGDIRATGNINITNSTVDSTSKCTNTSDKHNSTYNYIGQAYYVKFLDSDGKRVTIDGRQLTLADCNTRTQR